MHELVNSTIKFRNAIIESLQAGKLPETMSTFPRGCCGDSALLLGTYLTDIGLGDFTYVGGERGSEADGDWASHAWLTQGELTIDITKSQFSDCPDDITVTESSEWHDSFEVSQTFTANIKGKCDQLEPCYEAILETIKSI
ncbi:MULTISPECIES: hypothetical protein [unclassified Neptuniibacter]|uniref:hypothetical protein n=1 Tax=unclassified Neptuniibacter TaxID=2630693 RepID=UPI0025EB407E|nr:MULTISPECIES: hypothetical protein [unclassified Neptuniibacter]|tara:strand:+ start:9936 stop:10358 length:423 start_codon:yes stop_codon:yes gene_type:complete